MTGPRFYIEHPRLDARGVGQTDCSAAHCPWTPPNPDPLSTGRLRYIPPPTLLLLHTVHGLIQQQGTLLAKVPPERRGLLLDAYGAFDGLREEFSRPLRGIPPEPVSPLLFPHTSDMSAAAMAAILFDLKGSVMSLHANCEPVRGDTDSPFGGLVEEAHILLESGLCDLVFVTALQWVPMPLKADAVNTFFRNTGIPFVDCGVALLLTDADRIEPLATVGAVRRKAGFTGVCEPLLEYVIHD